MSLLIGRDRPLHSRLWGGPRPCPGAFLSRPISPPGGVTGSGSAHYRETLAEPSASRQSAPFEMTRVEDRHTLICPMIRPSGTSMERGVSPYSKSCRIVISPGEITASPLPCKEHVPARVGHASESTWPFSPFEHGQDKNSRHLPR